MSDRALINRTKRQIATIKRKLQALSFDWNDLDQFLSSELDDAEHRLNEVVLEMDEQYPARASVRRQA
jgi:hypothetical protein